MGPRRHRLSALILAALAAPAAAQSPPPSLATERAVPFEAIVNGARSGTWLFLERAGVLYAPAEAFDEWRVQLQPDAPAIEYKGSKYWPLSAVPGFRAKIDPATQSVELLFSPQAFSALRMTKELVKRPPVSKVLPSLVLNYDANYTTSRSRGGRRTEDLGVLGELRLSTQLGVLSTSATARNLTGDRSLGVPRKATRLETTFTRDFPDSNRTLRIGDTVTHGKMWGRDVFFGGVRFGTNFSLTPGFVSQPLPAVTGLSAAPSTVELYVNDVLRQVSSVPTGPFVIDNFPLMTGSGEARLVVRDLLGRETVVVQPFFTSSLMLAPGLEDWSLEAGRVRRDLALESNNYGDAFAGATWRFGASRDNTIEGRIEAGPRRKLAGAGLLTVLPGRVLGKLAAAVSDEKGVGNGGLVLAGVEIETPRGTASFQATKATPGFRELGHDDLLPPISHQYAGNVYYNAGRWGTVGFAYASINRFDDTRIATVSGNYSVRVGERSTITLTASRAIAGGSGSSVGLSLLVPLDAGPVVNATAGRRAGQDDLYVSAVQNPGRDSDLGWRVLAGLQQDERRAEGGAYYQGRYGALSADASVAQSQRALRVGAAGGLAWVGGGFFATRRIEESFALAEVPGYANIGIGIGSNVLARTDADGRALIPRLLPYSTNAIRIDPKELPISAEIASIEQVAVPAYRSAVKVEFPVRGGRGALLKIVFADGQPAPAGAIVTIEGDTEEFYVARRGEAFVTGLKPGSRVRLVWKDRACALAVQLPPADPDQIARVGPIACTGVER